MNEEDKIAWIDEKNRKTVLGFSVSGSRYKD